MNHRMLITLDFVQTFQKIPVEMQELNVIVVSIVKEGRESLVRYDGRVRRLKRLNVHLKLLLTTLHSNRHTMKTHRPHALEVLNIHHFALDELKYHTRYECIFFSKR